MCDVRVSRSSCFDAMCDICDKSADISISFEVSVLAEVGMAVRLVLGHIKLVGE